MYLTFVNQTRVIVAHLPLTGSSRGRGQGPPATRGGAWVQPPGPRGSPARDSPRFEVRAQLRQSKVDERGCEGALCGGGVGAYDRVHRGGAMHARLTRVELLVPVGRDEGGIGVQRDEGRAQRSCKGDARVCEGV